MENNYAIVWVAKNREKFGVGTKRFSKEEAEKLAEELNEDHGAFLHRAFDIEAEDPVVVIAAVRSAISTPVEAPSVGYPALVAAQAAAVVEPPSLVTEPETKIIPLNASFPEVLPAAGQ